MAHQIDLSRIEASRINDAACLVAGVYRWRIDSLKGCGFVLSEYQGPSHPFAPQLTVYGTVLVLDSKQSRTASGRSC